MKYHIRYLRWDISSTYCGLNEESLPNLVRVDPYNGEFYRSKGGPENPGWPTIPEEKICKNCLRAYRSQHGKNKAG